MKATMLLWMIPRIEQHTTWFRFVHVGFMAVGMARTLSIQRYGVAGQNTWAAVAVELAVPITFIVWQAYVPRAHSPQDVTG